MSHIELCTRYTTTMWGLLHESSAKLPSRTKWPPGVELPGLPTTEAASADKAPGKKGSDKETEVCVRHCHLKPLDSCFLQRAPQFSLAELLSSKA